MSYSCKNSHSSPFLHKPRSQCLHTTDLSPLTCRNGHRLFLLQVEFTNNSQTADADSFILKIMKRIFLNNFVQNLSDLLSIPLNGKSKTV